MKPKSKTRRSRIALVVKWCFIAIPVLAVAVFIGRSFEQADGTARVAGLPFYDTAEAAQPFPNTLSPSLFAGHTAHVYQVAKDIPGILAQQPCYCFCRTEGHKSLLHCFTSSHAAGCTICEQEALLVERLNREGKSAAEIRQAIARGDWRRQSVE